MQTILLLSIAQEGLLVKESYATVKKRLFDNQPFLEVTDMVNNKIIYSKAIVASLMKTDQPIPEQKKKGGKKK